MLVFWVDSLIKHSSGFFSLFAVHTAAFRHCSVFCYKSEKTRRQLPDTKSMESVGLLTRGVFRFWRVSLYRAFTVSDLFYNL